MEQKSQDQYLAWMMRYHVQWAPGFRCGSKSAVRMTGPTSSVPTSGREFDSCRRKHGNCNGECLQQHVCFAERKDRWMDRPTHRQLYVVPGSPDIVEFFRLPSTEHRDASLITDLSGQKSSALDIRSAGHPTRRQLCHVVTWYEYVKAQDLGHVWH